MIAGKWYDDPSLVSALPLRYRAYAKYSHLFGEKSSRRVPGGSFILRMLRDASALAGIGTVAPIHGLDDLTVMADFADERILEVIHEIRGENPEYRVMRELLRPGDTFVDVGANFGTFSLLASRLVGDTGSVIAIEPQPRLCSLIEQSIALSSAMSCRLVPRACGASDGTRRLLVPVDDSGRAGFFSGFSGARPHEEVEVSVTTLDRVVSDVSVSGALFVKIDVEGSEIDVLAGAVQTIAARHPTLMIEINPWSLSAAGHTPKEIIDLLGELGYRSLATTGGFPVPAGPQDIPLNKQLNIIATA